MTRRHLWAPALVVATVLAGCTPGVAQPSPSPTPTTAAPRPETEEQRTQRLAYEAAEGNYKSVVAEVDRIFNAGGAEQASKKMRELAAGPYLVFQTNEVRSAKALDLDTRGTIRVQILQRRGYNSEQLNFRSCEDASRIVQVNPRTGKSDGVIAIVDLEARKIDGVWKIWEGKYNVVSSCADY